MKHVALACILGGLLTITVSLTLWAGALYWTTAKSCVMPATHERLAPKTYPLSPNRTVFALGILG